MAALRVIQWATGGVGRAAIEGVLDHPDLELVGCWVHSPDKDGVDVGTLVGRDPIGVAATTDVDALLAIEADCVLYSPLFADPAVVEPHPRVGQERRHAARLVLPARPTSGRAFDAVCRAAGVTLHGTGIHPGGITERFPLVLSALSGVGHARPGRGVLRHPHLRRPRRHPRLDAVRHHARAGPDQHHGRRPRRRVPPVGVDGGRRARLRPRPPPAHHPRDGGRHRADRLAHRADRARAWWRRSGSAGRAWSTASRSSPPRSTG